MWGDLRTAIRSLRRSPLGSLVIVVILALGGGAAGAILEVVRGVLWAPLPYPDPDPLAGEFRSALPTLLGVAALLLLVSAANTALLLQARWAARKSEMAVRAALGAARGRLLRPLLAEVALLALAAGVAAAQLTSLLLRLLLTLGSESLPPSQNVTVDASVPITAGLTLIAGVLASLLPALRASRPADPGRLLRRG